MQSITLKRVELDYRSKEAYGTLRSNIEFSGDDIQVVCITSCTPNEGKSSVSMELARSFANNGKKVLLVDADLRKSVLKGKHQESGSARYGLTHLLIGGNSLDEVTCETDIDNLYVVFAGPVPPNPSELLGNKYFAAMIAEARELYDFVIVDTPPLGSVIDAAIVSKQCDGAMIVIACAETSRRFIKRVIEQLETANCRILGCILNKVDMTGNGKYYGKYYGNYGNYGNYGIEEAEKAAARAKKIKEKKAANRIKSDRWEEVLDDMANGKKNS